MAADPANDIKTFLLHIDVSNKVLLGTVRHWGNIKVAFDERSVWVKDLTFDQVRSIAIQSMPFKKIFYAKGQLLFAEDSLVPTGKIPSSLLWSPADRALPIEMPKPNHNFFGINEKINIKVIPSEVVKPPFALLIPETEAVKYILEAPKIRLEQLSWTVFDKKALIIGSPMLPVSGQVFWKNGDALLPAGYDFEFPILHQTIVETGNPKGENWMVWQANSDFSFVPKSAFKPLSRSSWRLTFSQL